MSPQEMRQEMSHQDISWGLIFGAMRPHGETPLIRRLSDEVAHDFSWQVVSSTVSKVLVKRKETRLIKRIVRRNQMASRTLVGRLVGAHDRSHGNS